MSLLECLGHELVHYISRISKLLLLLIRGIFSAVFENDSCPSGMVIEKVCHIPNLAFNNNPTRLSRANCKSSTTKKVTYALPPLSRPKPYWLNFECKERCSSSRFRRKFFGVWRRSVKISARVFRSGVDVCVCGVIPGTRNSAESKAHFVSYLFGNGIGG